MAFDGMRKHLADDFDAIYILDLGGNVAEGTQRFQAQCTMCSGFGSE